MTVKDYDRDALVVSVCEAMPGNGKLFFVATLAAVLAQGSRKAMENYLSVDAIDVCLVEMAFDSSNLIPIVGAVHPNADDLVKSGRKITEKSIRANLVYNEELGYHTLLAPFNDAKGVSPKFYRHVLSVLRRMFDVVIVSVGSRENNLPLRDVALEASHISLLLTSLDQQQLEAAGKWVDDVTAPGKKRAGTFDRRDIHVVVHRAEIYDKDILPVELEQLTVRRICDMVEEYLPGVPVTGIFITADYDGIIEVRGSGAEFKIHTERMDYPAFHNLGAALAKKVGRVLAVPADMEADTPTE